MSGELPMSDEAAGLPIPLRRATPPAGSLRPVDLRSTPDAAPLGAADARTLMGRRERLRRIVLGTLAGCGLILVAAAGAQVARASASTASTQPVAVLTRTPTTMPAPPSGPASAEATPPRSAEPAPSDKPSIGTLRLQWPAVPGHVWLDGEKITEASTVVACGKHDLRVGAKSRSRTVDIPCGGDFKTAR